MIYHPICLLKSNSSLILPAFPSKIITSCYNIFLRRYLGKPSQNVICWQESTLQVLVPILSSVSSPSGPTQRKNQLDLSSLPWIVRIHVWFSLRRLNVLKEGLCFHSLPLSTVHVERLKTHLLKALYGLEGSRPVGWILVPVLAFSVLTL